MAYNIKVGKSVTYGLNNESGDNLTVTGVHDDGVVVMLEVGTDQTILRLNAEQANKLYDAFSDLLDWANN